MSYEVGIKESLLSTVTRRFLPTRAADPIELKYYKVIDGVDYYATSLGMAAGFKAFNKHDRRNGEIKYVMPLPKGAKEETGHVENYPNVEGLFNKDLSEYNEITFNGSDIKKFVALHEVLVKSKPLNSFYSTAVMNIEKDKIVFSTYDSELKLWWEYPIENGLEMTYHYDAELMVAIWKGLGDFKLDEVKMYVNGENNPLFFYGKDIDYEYYFAINRKLVR